MKKVIASAVGLMLAGGVAATTASAVENQFGGYWRTRAYVQDNFDGTDSSSDDIIDTRTRLYYTAKFSDDFKFVNKFEINTTWGDDNGGDIGTDGTGHWRIKNSYADFNLGMANFKIGMQGATIARGFIFDDDMAGIMVTPKFGNVALPVFYTRVEDEEAGGPDPDLDLMGILASIGVSDAVTVTPYFIFLTGELASYATTTSELYFTDGTETWLVGVNETTVQTNTEADVWYLGADADVKMDALSLWATLIYNGGEIGDADVSAFLGAFGVDAGIVHAALIYASGDDDATDADINEFVLAPGRSHYWAEIMGLGVFDNRASNNAPGDRITNATVANVGVTIKPMDKLKLSFDAYWAAANELAATGTSTFDSENELGLELDGMATYELMDNLSLDAVLAYLIAGDLTGDEDVIEGGLRVSLKF